jgi:formamidopyrimidine-DNA glycosylase
VPELPEVQAHAERLSADFAGQRLQRFVPLTFTALKTAVPAPDKAYGLPLEEVGRRGKHLLVRFEPVTFVVHLMQGGRLLVDEKQAAKPRGGQARFVFDWKGPALLLTEQGTERRAGVWCVDRATELTSPPLDQLGPEADTIEPDELAARFTAKSMRLHGFLRDQRCIAGIGRRLANEVCHRARLSPFAMTGKLGPDDAITVVGAIRGAIAEGLDYERSRDDMSSSKDRPGRVHGRTGEACPVCGDTIRAVEYSGYTVNYCPTCQTGGRVLADNTTSKFLK